MKKVLVSIITMAGLVMAQSSSTSPILILIDMYNLETKGNSPQDALSDVSNRLDVANKLGQYGTYKVKSQSLFARQNTPVELSYIIPVPYLSDCSSTDEQPVQCKPIMVDTGSKISITPMMEKDGTFMLDSDLTYLDVSGYSKFEFKGAKLEIPQIQENRQKRFSLVTGERPVILVDKKDDTHYRITVISVNQPKKQK